MTIPGIQAYQLYPLGDTALVVQFGEQISPEVHQKVSAFAAYLEKHPFAGLIEFVPAFTTVTIYYNPWVVSDKGNFNPYTRITDTVQQMLSQTATGGKRQVPRVVDIPVCYGGNYGPDLEFVASHNQLSSEEVISIHTQGEYLVYMIGFAPGFPYLGGMDERIATPRKQNPRQAIPAGSVGIAGSQTGVYPIQTPGGWQLIGRTPLSLFNPLQQSPALLKAGDVVRFVSISEEEYMERKEQHES